MQVKETYLHGIRILSNEILVIKVLLGEGGVTTQPLFYNETKRKMHTPLHGSGAYELIFANIEEGAVLVVQTVGTDNEILEIHGRGWNNIVLRIIALWKAPTNSSMTTRFDSFVSVARSKYTLVLGFFSDHERTTRNKEPLFSQMGLGFGFIFCISLAL